MALELSERILAFEELGLRMEKFPANDFLELAVQARNNNSWFTLENVRTAWNVVRNYLLKSNLENWLKDYNFAHNKPKNIGVVMAGNIPLVGFHDFLSVIISGHILHAKLSQDDSILLKLIIKWIDEISPVLGQNIKIVERLNGVDAVIATGSNNTARYFEYYFKEIPHIIRKNRTSIAVLTGKETDQEVEALGDDIFTYFGLGCRNVSKIFVPDGFDFVGFLNKLETHNNIVHHHKYNNNYEYNKAIFLVNGEKFLDNGFLLVKESQDLSSPVGVLNYEFYSSEKTLQERVLILQNEIQCKAGNVDFIENVVSFGKTQSPTLNDYADGVNVLLFLSKI